MPYQRPEIVVVGDAANLIEGNKFSPTLEANSTVLHMIPDCELDD
jgi:hypothetical protein